MTLAGFRFARVVAICLTKCHIIHNNRCRPRPMLFHASLMSFLRAKTHVPVLAGDTTTRQPNAGRCIMWHPKRRVVVSPARTGTCPFVRRKNICDTWNYVGRGQQLWLWIMWHFGRQMATTPAQRKPASVIRQPDQAPAAELYCTPRTQ